MEIGAQIANHRPTIVALGLIALIAGTGLLLKDRIADGPFPGLSQGMRYFDDNEVSMNAWVRRLESDRYAGSPCSTTEKRLCEKPKNQTSAEYSSDAVSDFMTWRVDGGYLLYVGFDRRYGRDFNVAYVWRERGLEVAPRCSSVANLRDFGKCIVPLRDGWVLDYEWTPSDFESAREKSVMELAEEVADELSTS